MMFFFNEGRRPLLDFLRNITPQTLVIALTIVMGNRLDFTVWDWSNLQATVFFYALAITALLAFAANLTLFIDASVTEAMEKGGLKTELDKLVGQTKGVFGQTRASLTLAWSHRKMFFVELVIIMAVLQVGAVAAAVTGIMAATSMMKTLHG